MNLKSGSLFCVICGHFVLSGKAFYRPLMGDFWLRLFRQERRRRNLADYYAPCQTTGNRPSNAFSERSMPPALPLTAGWPDGRQQEK
jgi:hypothetical protein